MTVSRFCYCSIVTLKPSTLLVRATSRQARESEIARDHCRETVRKLYYRDYDRDPENHVSTSIAEQTCTLAISVTALCAKCCIYKM